MFFDKEEDYIISSPEEIEEGLRKLKEILREGRERQAELEKAEEEKRLEKLKKAEKRKEKKRVRKEKIKAKINSIFR